MKNTPTIGSEFDAKHNSFDLVRLLAAITVLVSHSWAVTGRNYEPFLAYLGGFDTGGGWAVSIFFVISGFLVTRSLENRDVGSYLASRVLRILPALALVTAFETFLVAPAFFNGGYWQYFASGGIHHLFNIDVFEIQTELHGVFSDLPSHGLNASLWTLPVECSFYLVLPFLGPLLFGNRLLAIVPLLLSAIAFSSMLVAGYGWSNQGGALFASVPLFSGLRYLLFFLTGATMWLWRESLPLSSGLAVTGVLLLYAAHGGVGAPAVFHVVLPYLTIYCSVCWRAGSGWLGRIGDLSYGTYLFAFPVQQSVVAILGVQIGPLRLAAIALVVTLPLAFLSWKLVERPALRLKSRLGPGFRLRRDGPLQKAARASVAPAAESGVHVET